jgi:ATP-binding cassette subfamily F protein uup
MAVLLSCQSLSKSYGLRPLFRNITLGIEEDERLGLIGPNGSGKSTLIKLFAGLEKPDDGTISVRRNLRLGYLPQEESFASGATVESTLSEALAGGAWDDAERQALVSAMIGRMEFAQADQEASTLSGGWRKRLALARELIREPDLLMLDEPTNHLDLEGVLWLEEQLRGAPFAFLLISHDRVFLENVTNRTVELNQAYAEGFLSVNGPYSEFLVRREEYLSAQAHQEEALAGRVKREIEWLRRGPQARTTKAQYRIDEAGRLMQNLADLKYRNSSQERSGIDFSASGRKTRDLLVAKDIGKSLGGRELFSHLDLTLSPGTKLGLIGPNGSGKTTLIRLMTGETESDGGAIKRADGLRVVAFDQSRAALDKRLTLRDALSPNSDTVTYRDSTIHISSWAKRFRFRPEQLFSPLSVFSGGEQARVLIAQLMLLPADILILDEPTNDLDIPTLEVLEDSLQDFPGALVLVTHDRYLLETISTEVLALDGEGGARLFADYAQWETVGKPSAVAVSSPPKPLATAAAPLPARMSTAERREWKGIEEKISAAEGHVTSLEKMLTDPTVASDQIRLQQCWDDLAAAKEAVSSLYDRWAELDAKQG